MSIRTTLLGGGAALSLIIAAVLALTIYTFASLSAGFVDIIHESKIGVNNSQTTQSSITKASGDLSQVTEGLLGVVDDINRTNMTMKILARKIKQLSGTLDEITENVEYVVEDMPEGDARDEIEDMADTIGDVKEEMRREALISLSQTVSKMGEFTESIGGHVGNVKQLSVTLNEGSQLSADVASANQQIQSLSQEFGIEIGSSRNIIISVLGGFIVLCLLATFLLVRIITRPLIRAVEVSQAIAHGDLSQHIEVKSKNEIGQLLAAMKEMQSTLLQVIEQDVLGLVGAAKEGNLTHRIALEDKQGCYQELSSGINELVEVNARVIDDSSRVFSALARGDMSQTIEGDYQGSFGELKESANSSVAKQAQVTEVIGRDFRQVVDAAVHGDLSQRIDTSVYEGVFVQLGTDLNELLEIAEHGLGDVGRVLQALSHGRLDQHVDAEYQGMWDQLKTDANATVDKLQVVVSEISQAATEVSRGSAEITQGNTALSTRTEEQASNLEETASAMEEMAATVKQNADNARHATQLVESARAQAEHGDQVATQTVTAMASISEASKKIADIITVIDEIAFQTNLLALNAAVEAARAGEQGRGFAVVASEVRNLAGRSATAAKEIKELIVDSVNRVKEGDRLVDESGQSLSEIMGSVKKVADIVSEISAASNEQSEGVDQINKAVMQLDEMTQQNAALVEEAASASASVGGQAHHLDKMVAFFHTEEQEMVVESDTATQIPAANDPAKPGQAPVEQPLKVAAAAGGGDVGEWEEF